MAESHESGIPHRSGACFCLLGKTRGEMGVVEATEETEEFDNIVGNAPRAAGHRIYTVAYNDATDSEGGRMKHTIDGINDNVNQLGCLITAWGNYPTKTSDFDITPEFIIKIKRNIDVDDEDKLFPRMTITMRPLYCDLEYNYVGNANVSGQGEVGYESEDVQDDSFAVAWWSSDQAMPRLEGEGGWLTAPDENGNRGMVENEAAITQYNENWRRFLTYCVDEKKLFPLVYLEERHYWRNKDRPSEAETPFETLKDWEIEPTIYPNSISDSEPYNFIRNESYDCRHRYPLDYFQKHGELLMSYTEYDKPKFFIPYDAVKGSYNQDVIYPITLGTWEHTKFVFDPINPIIAGKTNPEFEPNKYLPMLSTNSDEGIAPIIKRWYWDGTSPPSTGLGLQHIFGSESFKLIKDIRKRYCFSFKAKGGYVGWSPELYVFDHFNCASNGNLLTYWAGYETQSGEIAYVEVAYPVTYSITSQSAKEVGGFLEKSWNFVQDSYFNCISTWALEINCKVEDWNFVEEVKIDQYTGAKKKVKRGATISGYISLAYMAIYPAVSNVTRIIYEDQLEDENGEPYGEKFLVAYWSDNYRFYSSWDTKYLGWDASNTYLNCFFSPSVVYRTERKQIDVDDAGTPIYDSTRRDAGKIPWSITLTEEHAKGKPVKFDEIEVSPYYDKETGTNHWDDRTMVYITDFVVTNISPP